MGVLITKEGLIEAAKRVVPPAAIPFAPAVIPWIIGETLHPDWLGRLAGVAMGVAAVGLFAKAREELIEYQRVVPFLIEAVGSVAIAGTVTVAWLKTVEFMANNQWISEDWTGIALRATAVALAFAGGTLFWKHQLNQDQRMTMQSREKMASHAMDARDRVVRNRAYRARVSQIGDEIIANYFAISDLPIDKQSRILVTSLANEIASGSITSDDVNALIRPTVNLAKRVQEANESLIRLRGIIDPRYFEEVNAGKQAQLRVARIRRPQKP